ncbi:MAG: sulfatase-like hydrolase/transferase [Candidatus Eisenbacteria bacterium]
MAYTAQMNAPAPLSQHRTPTASASLALGVLLTLIVSLGTGCGSDSSRGGGDVTPGASGSPARDGSAPSETSARHATTQVSHDAPASAAAQLQIRFPYESAEGIQRPDAGRPNRPNVLLLTLDTTRMDRLSVYGATTGTTPNLAEFAKEALVFDEAFASAPTTLPSHTTILTGLEPFEHGVRNNGIHALAPSFETLAESTKELGYSTGAILGAFPVSSPFGLDQGFDHFDDAFTVGVGTPVPQRIAEDVSRLGLEWIKQHREEPWFCWLHYFDPHDPYAPPPPYQDIFPNPYDGELAYMDAHIGGLFRELKRQGLWNNTLVVITADHGEGLGDHREPTHSLFVYDTTVQVPLLLRFPPTGPWENAAFHGRRLSSLVGLADITPTVLDVLGGDFTPGAAFPGSSIVPAIVSSRPVRDVAYMETLVPELDYGWSPYRAVVAEGHKFILAPRPELYDLAADPGETTNLYDAQPERAQRLLEHVADRMERDHSAENLALDQATIDKLRSLGYVAGGGASSTGPLPDAKDMLWAIDAFDQARDRLLEKDVDGAGARLDQVLDRDPKNRFARRMKSWVLLQQGRGKEAEELCRTILRDEPDAADIGATEQRLTEAVLLQGDAKRAHEMVEQLLGGDAAEVSEGSTIELLTLAIRTRAADGDLAGAKAALRQAQALDADRVEPVVAYGNALEHAGRWAEAGEHYTKAMEQFGNHIELLAGLASVDLNEGRAQEAANRAAAVVQADPTHAKGNYVLGNVLVLGGKPGQAVNNFVRAVKTEPGNPEYQARLGNHCLAGQNYPKAVEHLTRAIELGRNDAPTRAALGMAQAALGDKRIAKRNLETALDQAKSDQLRKQIRDALTTIAEPGSTGTQVDD